MAPAADEYAGFEDWVWSRLPASKWVAGRRRVVALLPLALDRWSDDMAQAADSDGPAHAFMAESLRRDVRRIYGSKRYGSIWIIVLSSLISELVRLLVLWWLSDTEHRQLFHRWRRRADA